MAGLPETAVAIFVTSCFELFKVGIGPSSSHTMGPMLAAADFAGRLTQAGVLSPPVKVRVELFGSLALTGRGHATDTAVMIGLVGFRPDHLDPEQGAQIVTRVDRDGLLRLGGRWDVGFMRSDILFLHKERLPFHPNALRFCAYDAVGRETTSRTYYSVGGGAIVDDDAAARNDRFPEEVPLPFAFNSSAELLAIALREKMSIAQIVRANECALRCATDLDAHLLCIEQAMDGCIDRGMAAEGVLPGRLAVRRRSHAIHARLLEPAGDRGADALAAIDWVSLWALAVNEENAAGGRVVTAPTNGAAGIIPAVLRYYKLLSGRVAPGGVAEFLLTATAIGGLFKRNASISGAEVGCQGEVGVACSMAAAGLAAVMGGTPAQIENAAEIAMEHNLGLTCDPIAGLVQVPCIERNAVGAVKAIEAARLALLGDGRHHVSLDQVIETMRVTGADMSDRYKETSLGGLAVNAVEC